MFQVFKFIIYFINHFPFVGLSKKGWYFESLIAIVILSWFGRNVCGNRFMNSFGVTILILSCFGRNACYQFYTDMFCLGCSRNKTKHR